MNHKTEVKPARVQITLVKSLIGRGPHRVTAHTLGLRKPHQVVEHVWTPAIQGMLSQIDYLIEVKVLET
jgi:ribosomal protein L30